MRERGVTYRELAKRVGVSFSYLNQVVRGKRAVPGDDMLDAIGRALGTDGRAFREYWERRLRRRFDEELLPALLDSPDPDAAMDRAAEVTRRMSRHDK
jgi:transcriptional regulator with XRE-family HTH domain